MFNVVHNIRTLTSLADAGDAARFGHKAAHLASLLKVGFDIPGGFVVASDVEPDADDIASGLAAMGDASVAVRSSSLAEDLPDASFAGQYLSVLQVRGTSAVLDALRRVRESATSLRARTYSGNQTAGMAVIIQHMVLGDASGVAFSANPMTGNRREVLISATRGLGDALVSGEVAGDEWTVEGSGPRLIAGTQDAISADAASRIAELARRVEAHLGCPADIEWTIQGGRILLLQARPITVLPIHPDITTPKGTWQKDAAHSTEPVTPFSASTYVTFAAQAINTLLADWGMLPDRLEAKVVGHEIYMHVEPDDGGKTPPPWWVLGAVVRVIPSLRKKLEKSRAMVEAGMLESIPERWEHEHRSALHGKIERLAAVDLSSLTDNALAAHLEQVLALGKDAMTLHFQLAVPYAVGVYEFVRACEEFLGMGLPDTMRMLQGLSITSSAPTRELADVAACVRERPHLRAALALPDAFERLDADPAAGTMLRAWMRRWGLRTIGYDPGQPSFAERPSLVIGLLAELIDGPREQDLQANRAQAVEHARRRLSGAALERFNRTLAFAEKVYPQREDNVFYTDNLPAGLLRLVGLEMGRRLVHQGRLVRATDMAMLSVDEMRSSADLKALVIRRRSEIAWVRANPGPLLYGPKPGPAPDLRGLPEASRRLNSALIWLLEEELTAPEPSEGADLNGLAASAGVVTGRVRVILSANAIEDLRPGEILVCPVTTPAWTLVFPRAAALVTDAGSLLSHAAIIAREHGLPAVVATGNATRRLRDGQVVTVDGNRGIVTVAETPY